MSKPTPEQPDSALAEQLVAYLDGELARDQSEQVERRVRDDDHVRRELQQYDRVWNALDDLPRATVDDSFTKTTIQMVAASAEQDLAQQTALLPIRRRNRRLQLAGLCVAGLLLGFTLLALVAPNPNRQLYLNLPVISGLDAYSEISDVDFLRMLSGDEAAGWLLAEGGPQVDGEAQTLAELTAASYRERRDYVADLDDDQRTELAKKARRYERLSAPLRAALKERHQTIAAADDAPQLQRTMLAYYAWLGQTDELDQAKLRVLAPPQRLAQMKQMRERQMRESETRLTPAGEVALREAFERMAVDREILKLRKKFLESLATLDKLPMPERGPEMGRARMVQNLATSEPRQTMSMVIFFSAFVADAPRRPGGESEPSRKEPRKNFLEGHQPFQRYHDAIEENLLAALDEQTAERLRGKNPRDRSRLLSRWLWQSKRRKSPDVATLENYFVSGEIPPDQQQELLSLPKEDMLRELERLYMAEMFGEGDTDEEADWWMRGGFDRGRSSRHRDRGSDDRGPRGEGPPLR